MNKLKNYFKYPRFQGQSYKIMYLNDDYFLQQASIQALKDLGHDVMVLKLVKDPSKMLEMLLKSAVVFRPDCIMGINHGGYDPEGKIGQIVAELEIPVIFWYLDDFRFIIFNGKHQANAHTAIFTFEREHVPLLEELGFHHVFYLPSASSITARTPVTLKKFESLGNAVTFVGNTFDSTKQLRTRKQYGPLFEELAGQLDFTRLYHDLVDRVRDLQGQHFDNMDDLYHYAGYVIAGSTQIYRQHVLSNLGIPNLTVIGDNKWKKLIQGVHILGPTHYETETPSVYHYSGINLNLSSQQLGSTVSLRVFDVPAAGGFLISDFKESLEELFDFEREVVTFQSEDELRDKIKYYETHAEVRKKIAEAAHRRVMAEHLIQHRMRVMLTEAKKIWG